MKFFYSTKIKHDCNGYELELKKRRTASSQKLATAQRAMKEAALEKFDEQNKYDLGQCIVRMRECVAITGGCGDDFTKCTFYNTGEGLSGNSTPVNIPGASTTIKVGQGTLDSVQSKRKVCEATVTKNCVAVRDEVWPAFLIEIAPTLKSAEILAEDSSRQNILESISNCFQKACASKFDPKQEDADYDACLGNPELMRDTCKVVLEQAGIPISEVKNTGSTNPIWKFVIAKLAAMRVDACTNAIRSGLEDEMVCGKDFIACASMDAEFLRDVIPIEKLTPCIKNGETLTADDWTERGKIGNIAMGIFMNADNAALKACTTAAAKKVMALCGIDGGYSDEDLSEASPEMLADCDAAFDSIKELGGFGAGDAAKIHELLGQDIKLVGLIDFTKFTIAKAGDSVNADIDEYYPHLTFDKMAGASADISNSAAEGIMTTIRSRINSLFVGTDGQTLKFCTEGRDLSQIAARASRYRTTNSAARRAQEKHNKTEARYPSLLDTVVENILNSGLRKAKELYNAKLNIEAEKYQEKLREVMVNAPEKGYIDESLGICWHKQ
jgi:hypothetical protein